MMHNEVIIRLGFFFGIFALVAFGEHLVPRRTLNTKKAPRWFSNLGMVFLNSLVVRLIFSIMPVGMALLAQKKGWGLLNNIDLPYWINVVVGVIVLDFAIYLQHVMFHFVCAYF
jgi:sterol desaturase/sphingolipid hydroxylase (fatty acid hydroxylase superfamily)